MSNLEVLDFSHSQQVNSFHDIAADNVSGVIMKAGQGLSMVDETYQDRRCRARECQLLLGSYYFLDSGDGAAQADRYLQIADPQPDEIVVADWEVLRVSLATAEHFVEHIHDKLDRWPKFYSYISFMNERNVPADSPLRQCGLWIARYGPVSPVPPWAQEGGWLHQFTGDGVGQPPFTSPGVVGNVDRSVWLGTADELTAWWTQ
jgi:GH25 family lysozyme M1 (1,4-beta-N-acetylmuramidase)